MVFIWDYFGVIADDAFWYEAQNLAERNGESHKLKVASQRVNQGALTWQEFCEEVSRDTGVPLNEVIRRYNIHNINMAVIETIRNTKDRARHVVLSNASHLHLLPLMKELGLSSLFDEIFVSSLIGYAKPDHRAFKHVLRALDCEADETFLIDDMAKNVDAANELGIGGVVYTKNTDIYRELRALL